MLRTEKYIAPLSPNKTNYRQKCRYIGIERLYFYLYKSKNTNTFGKSMRFCLARFSVSHLIENCKGKKKRNGQGRRDALCDHLIRHGYAVPPSPRGEGLTGEHSSPLYIYVNYCIFYDRIV